jgi:opine dehydrogenase
MLVRKHGPFERGGHHPLRPVCRPAVFPQTNADHALSVIDKAFPGVIESCGDILFPAPLYEMPVPSSHPPVIIS